MPSYHFPFRLYNQWTLKSEMYDYFLSVRNYGKLSAKFLSGTSMVIEKGGTFVVFYFSLEQLLKFVLKFLNSFFSILSYHRTTDEKEILFDS